ncbi:hypothetical protein JTB14_034529 [Gonioctena quinquepunctata]|nr:hypothetical protein JTB14_034529 [Gonioctena quinquepunctata]
MIEMEADSYPVFRTILGYCLFIVISPITTFFVSKRILFEGILGTTPLTTNVWSAIFAVIMLHIAFGLYVYRAYFEADKVKKPEQKID